MYILAHVEPLNHPKGRRYNKFSQEVYDALGIIGGPKAERFIAQNVVLVRKHKGDQRLSTSFMSNLIHQQKTSSSISLLSTKT